MFGVVRGALDPAFPGGWREAVVKYRVANNRPKHGPSSGFPKRQTKKADARSTDKFSGYLSDMEFLWYAVPEAQPPERWLQHDSHHCQQWPGSIPFPDEFLVDDEYVGKAYDEKMKNRCLNP